MRACTTLCSRVQTRPAFPCAARRQLAYKSVALPRPPQLAPSTAASIRNYQSRKLVVMEALITPMHIAIGAVGVAALVAWVDAVLKSKKPQLIYQPTAFNTAVMSRCPTLRSVYQCTPFLTNGHVETIVVAKLRKPPGVDYRREVILTQDGGAVAIDWEHVDDDGKPAFSRQFSCKQELPADAPVLILFPGLTGGSGDSYVQHAVLQARHAGIRAAVFNSRGTADSPVITPQFYSASFTDDTREVVAHVRKCYPDSTLFAAGWSLGANILVNYLGEQGADTPLEAAVSMCNPFDLTISNRQINEGFNKIYNWNLAASLKRIFAKHELIWRGHPGPAKPHLVPDCKTIREFDEAITVHSFDWANVDAYYAGSSSAKRIPAVNIPLLCIQALDDPIAPAEAIPCNAIEDNPNCMLAVTPCGGHLGWAAGPGAPFNHPWTDTAVVEWLTSVHVELMKRKQGRGTSSVGSSGHGVEQQQEPAAAAAAAASFMNKVQAGSPQQVSVSVSASSSNSNSFVATPPPVAAAGAVLATADTPGGNSSKAIRSRSAASRLEGLKQQQQLTVDAEPALTMEQMWWGEIKSPRDQSPRQQQQQQQQQGVMKQAEQQHGSSSSSKRGNSVPSAASSSPEPVTGVDVVLPGAVSGADSGASHIAGQEMEQKPVEEPAVAAAAAGGQQIQVHAAAAAVDPAGGRHPQVRHHTAASVSEADMMAAADWLTAQVRWAL